MQAKFTLHNPNNNRMKSKVERELSDCQAGYITNEELLACFLSYKT